MSSDVTKHKALLLVLACVGWAKACLSIRVTTSIPRSTMAVCTIHLGDDDGDHDDHDCRGSSGSCF